MILMVYVPCPDIECARSLGRALVQEKLAACCNILPSMESIYVWDSKLCEEKEVLLLAKTRKAQWPELRDRVKSLHPYKIPAIVAYPSHDSNTDYAAWMSAQLKSSHS